MTIFEAAVLGVVQGVTEFLPISSTAHLRVVPALVGWADPGASFTAVIQLGTLAAVLAFFASDLAAMLRGTLGAIADPDRRHDPQARLLGYLVVGTLPVVIAGIVFKKAIRGELRALSVIAAAQVIVGVALAIVERRARHERGFDEITWGDVLIIGCAQTLALVPGVSRSGITILAAMAVGLRRDGAARFSFLLSIPAVAGAGVFEMGHVLHSDVGGVALVVGLLTAAVTGYAQHRLATSVSAHPHHDPVRDVPNRARRADLRAALCGPAAVTRVERWHPLAGGGHRSVLTPFNRSSYERAGDRSRGIYRIARAEASSTKRGTTRSRSTIFARGHREALPAGVPFVELDVRQTDAVTEALKTHAIDCVMHFAALAYVGESVDSPLLYYDNNTGGTLSLLTAAARHR